MKKVMLIVILSCLAAVLLGITFFWPVVGKIIEDRPVLTFFCQVQPLAYVGKCGELDCTGKIYDHYQKLSEWGGFKGCNESTQGYDFAGHIKENQISCCKVVVLT